MEQVALECFLKKNRSDLSLKKTPHVWLLHAKTFYCYVILNCMPGRVICMKLKIGKKITGLEMMTLNRERI